MKSDQLTFIVDLNDVRDDGCLVIAMDFTQTYGPCRTIIPSNPPQPGDRVDLYSDADDVALVGTVQAQLSALEYTVRPDLDTYYCVSLSVTTPGWRATTWGSHSQLPALFTTDRFTLPSKFELLNV